MAFERHIPSGSQATNLKPLSFPIKFLEKAESADPDMIPDAEIDVDVDVREVYFLIMHFLSGGPCQRTCGQFWNELLEHDLLPRRYHAWYSRSGASTSDENDDGMSFPLSYNKVAERYPHIEKDHLVKLLKQLLHSKVHLAQSVTGQNVPNAADVPTLLGTGSFSLLGCSGNKANLEVSPPPIHLRWPHMHADQVRGLRLREIGGGFSRHHRSPSTRAARYTIAKPSTMVQKMQNIKKMRGHRNSVYCAIFDRSGRFVITGSDDRLVKIWSMETAYCLASCRGHEGDITDLAVSSNNALVASSSNDCIIRVWRLPDGQPISVLRGHTGVVTAIAFSPRPSAVYQLLSSSDDGTCRLWDARYSQFRPRIYLPRPPESIAGKNNSAAFSSCQQNRQIFCCAFNASGTVFVTGSSDNLARVWNACKPGTDDSDQPIYEMDVLSGHENDVNYVQFSGCAVATRFSGTEPAKEENLPKFRNSWFAHDNIVTCSRDGSAIIWIPRSRKSHGKAGRWTRAYHLKVPPPPMPPQPLRGGPRQRALPTPRGVNMIVWSLDNRFVLAAIMDCRICVWNAADGSLVHSLTGHTDSTYVLDVHPFNPRIAMSAGYDGKTIIWDIWEGKPIRTYETGHFRLVDGKFSPDGTSIILSDDVGQLYILSTGQGESQKDAKYDQFFLGDYRPLIRDTHGNVVDQETQLPPYRRNMQDLLCDSSMIPYPEPYQSMYQQRRLGTLGIEWRPSSVRFAVGPDFNSEQEQILPLPDWDVLIDPLPEFADAMVWEPEPEAISDDTDSEFNIADSFGGDGWHISSTSSGDLECSSGDDSEAECRDGPHRTRRKKKRQIEITTSSGRRVKRRNLDECDGNSHRLHQRRRSKVGHKPSKKKPSKASRPRRAAARNALTLFSKIKGRSSDGEDDYGSEDESSESESVLEDSSFESEESDKIVPDEQTRDLKGKGVAVDEPEDVHRPKYFLECHETAWNRKKLVLKLPLGDSTIGLFSGNVNTRSDNLTYLVGPSSTASDVPVDDERVANHKALDRVGWLGGYNNETMRWGGVRVRSSKRLRLSEATCSNAPGFGGPGTSHNEHESNSAPELNLVNVDSFGMTDGKDQSEEIIQTAQTQVGNPEEMMDASPSRAVSGSTRCQVPNELQGESHVVANHGSMHSMNGDLTNFTPGATQNNVSMRLRISSKKIISEDPNSTNDIKTMPVEANEKMSEYSAYPGNMPVLEQRSSAEEFEQETSLIKDSRDHRESNGVPKEDGSNVNGNATTSTALLLDSQASHPPRIDRMYSAVYRRSRSSKASRTASDNDGPHMGESTSNPSSGNVNLEATVADSVELKDAAEGHPLNAVGRSMERSRRADVSQLNRVDPLPREKWGSGITVGLRSSRNRRINFVRDASPVDRRKPSQSQRKLSWLMLSLPDCTRYIPQQGDEVAYLRQGHEEYLSYNRSSSRGPWECLKGEIRAVEFCKIVDLDYSTVPGSGDSCCKLALEFVDSCSSVCGKTFKLTLPEVTSFPDFLVERTRFEAAINKKWTVRDKCQVWWKNEGEEDGSWWEGRVMQVKAKSPEFPDSPWERYVIRYKSDPADTHSHSPWELHDADTTEWDQPHLDHSIRNKLLSSLFKLAQTATSTQDPYGVQKLRQVSEKSNFLNRFPVPLSLDIIQSRLENNYYRSLEAVKHDIKVMLSNAESYFGKNAELLKKIGRLSEWFTRILSSL